MVKPGEEVCFLPTHTASNPCGGKVFTVESHRRKGLSTMVCAALTRAMEADADGDGSITLSEFKSFLDRHGITLDQHFAEIFCVQDADANYELDLEEFKSLLLQTRLVAVQDNNEDGSAAEFGVDEKLFRLLARSFFAKADTDGDGLIDRAEFGEIMRARDTDPAARRAAASTGLDERGLFQRDAIIPT